MCPLKCCCVWSQLTVMVQDRKSCLGQYEHNNNLWLGGLLREATVQWRPHVSSQIAYIMGKLWSLQFIMGIGYNISELMEGIFMVRTGYIWL